MHLMIYLSEAAEHHVGQQLTYRVPARHRPRVECVEDAVWGRVDLEVHKPHPCKIRQFTPGLLPEFRGKQPVLKGTWKGFKEPALFGTPCDSAPASAKQLYALV